MAAEADPLRLRFERAYAADPDPWDYATSRYEDEKYERTLEALPLGPITNALEIGCSIGVLTGRLACRCERLTAIDVSDRAIAAARERLRDVTNVELIRSDLRDEMPPGPFDLIVCSEVLYYLEPGEASSAIERIETAMSPGASLVAVNWLGEDDTAPMRGEQVHYLIDGRERLRSAHREQRPVYLIERWELVP